MISDKNRQLSGKYPSEIGRVRIHHHFSQKLYYLFGILVHQRDISRLSLDFLDKIKIENFLHPINF